MKALPSDALSPSFFFLFSFSFLYVQPSVTHRYRLELPYWRIQATQGFVLTHLVRHLHISHNAPYLSPKILRNLCFSFLLGVRAVPREIENNAYAKFLGANKVIMADVQVAYAREFRTVLDLDSTPGISDSLSVELGFRLPIDSGIADSLSCIPDSKAKDSGFQKQKIPKIRNPDSLSWGDLHL